MWVVLGTVTLVFVIAVFQTATAVERYRTVGDAASDTARAAALQEVSPQEACAVGQDVMIDNDFRAKSDCTITGNCSAGTLEATIEADHTINLWLGDVDVAISRTASFDCE